MKKSHFLFFNKTMAEQEQQAEKVEITNLDEIDLPDDLKCELTELDRKVYLAGCALEAHISNHTEFQKGHYPYDEVAGYCARWADAVLYACGAGGSPQGGGGTTGGNSGPGTGSGGSGGSLGCGASASGNGSTCSGTCTANASGGSPPYEYQWSSGENTKTINNKCSGTYHVSCKDSTGKIATASCTLT